MSSLKFNNQDRKVVIEEVQRVRDEQLNPVSPYSKLVRSKDRKYYCVVGGTGLWHGITESIFDEIERAARQSFLVIALKKDRHYEIYIGHFSPLENNRSSLSYSKRGVYQFHVEEQGNKACIREVDDYCLNLEAVVDTRGNPQPEKKEHTGPKKGAKSKNLIEEFEKLSEEKQRLVLKKLAEKT